MRMLQPASMLVMVLLSGCVLQPRYAPVTRYEAPPPGAEACLDRCAQAIKACHLDCQERRHACVAALEPEARTRHADALKRYEAELRHYHFLLDQYRLDLLLGWGPYWGGPWGWYGLFPPSPPPAPVAPRLADEINRLARQRCDADCGCQPAYDGCFLGCGGKVVRETQCIANCPPDKPKP